MSLFPGGKGGAGPAGGPPQVFPPAPKGPMPPQTPPIPGKGGGAGPQAPSAAPPQATPPQAPPNQAGYFQKLMSDPKRMAMLTGGLDMLSQGYSTMPQGKFEGIAKALKTGMAAGAETVQANEVRAQEEAAKAEKEKQKQAFEDMMKSPILSDAQKQLLRSAGPGAGALQYGTQMINAANTAKAEKDQAEAQRLQIEQYMNSAEFAALPPQMQQLIRFSNAPGVPSAAVQTFGNVMRDQMKPPEPGEAPPTFTDRIMAGGTGMDNAALQAINEIMAQNPGVTQDQINNDPALQQAVRQRQNELFASAPTVETEEDRGVGRVYAERFAEARQMYSQAQDMITRLDAFDAVAARAGNTGPLSSNIVAIQEGLEQAVQVFPSLAGFQSDINNFVQQDMPSARNLNALTNAMALTVTKELEGQISEKELQFAINTVPGLDMTPASRELMSGLARNKAWRQSQNYLIEEQLRAEGLKGNELARKLVEEERRVSQEYRAMNDTLVQGIANRYSEGGWSQYAGEDAGAAAGDDSGWEDAN